MLRGALIPRSDGGSSGLAHRHHFSLFRDEGGSNRCGGISLFLRGCFHLEFLLVEGDFLDFFLCLNSFLSEPFDDFSLVL